MPPRATAAATVGGALAVGEADLALGGVRRVAPDVGLMFAAGLLVFGTKRLSGHHRRSFRSSS